MPSFKPYTPTEGDEQAAVFGWAEMAASRWPELNAMYAIPNGVQISGPKKWGAIMALKKRGLKPGMLDLCLPVARCRYHALYVEMKRVRDSVTSPEQKWWVKRLRELGNYAAVCEGATEAIALLTNYLSEKVP